MPVVQFGRSADSSGIAANGLGLAAVAAMTELKMNKVMSYQKQHSSTSPGIAANPLLCTVPSWLLCRSIEKPLPGVFVFAKRGEPLLPTKEAKKD